jgi:branched-chain amino acid transport system substrate-binding protein
VFQAQANAKNLQDGGEINTICTFFLEPFHSGFPCVAKFFWAMQCVLAYSLKNPYSATYAMLTQTIQTTRAVKKVMGMLGVGLYMCLHVALNVARAAELKPLDVGLLVPMNGMYKNLGEETRNVTQLVFKEQQAELAQLGYRLNFKIYDDQNNPVSTVQQAQKIVQDQNILAVLGSYNDDNSLTAASMFYPHKLGLLTLASGTSLTPNNFDNINRVVAQLKIKSIYMVSDLNPDSSSLLDKLEGFVQKNKIEHKGRGRVLSDTVIANIVKVLAQEKPNLVFYAGERMLGDKLLKQIRRAKLDVVYLGSNSLDQLDAESDVDDSGLGTYFVSFSAPIAFYPLSKDFAKTYQKTFGKPLTGYGIMIHDAAVVMYQALVTAIQNNGGKTPTREQVKVALRKARFSSSSEEVFGGSLAFNARGERKESSVFIYQVGDDGLARVVSNLTTSQK